MLSSHLPADVGCKVQRSFGILVKPARFRSRPTNGVYVFPHGHDKICDRLRELPSYESGPNVGCEVVDGHYKIAGAGYSLAVDQNPFPEECRYYARMLSRLRKGQVRCAGRARLPNILQLCFRHVRVDGVRGVKDS